MCKQFIQEVLLGETADGPVKQEREGKKPGRGVILDQPQPDPVKELWSVNYASESVLTGGKGAGLSHPHNDRLRASGLGGKPQAFRGSASESKMATQPKTFLPGKQGILGCYSKKDKGTRRESGGTAVICNI